MVEGSQAALRRKAVSSLLPEIAECQINAASEHDPEKWTPVFRRDHVQTKDEIAIRSFIGS